MSIVECALIVVVGFLILGPKELIQVAKKIVSLTRQFKNFWRDLENKLLDQD